MTATASHADMKFIQESLGLKNCKVAVGNPDRANICYEKVFRQGEQLGNLSEHAQDKPA